MEKSKGEGVYAVRYESGFSSDELPLWTDHEGSVNPFESSSENKVTRVDISEVPGAFQLLNVLTKKECREIIRIAESLGFHQDSPVSLPHNIRHNDNMNWVVSPAIDSVFWERSKGLVSEGVDGQPAKGINARFRFYKYHTGDYFSPHTDGAWPGSRVIEGVYVEDAYPGLLSQFTYLIFLNDDYEGGRTEFLVSKDQPLRPSKNPSESQTVGVKTPQGAVLCFPHGLHPLHCLHSGEKVLAGTKYVIRTDILYGK